MKDLKSYLESNEGQLLTLASHRFPGFWRSIFPAGFEQLPFPKEEKATCFACPRVSDCSYREDYRCCTYHPRVPNFALGLASVSDEGRLGLAQAHSQGMLLPEGMLASPRQWLDFMDDQYQNRYGKSDKVLCPFLAPQTGACRIHNVRNAVCSTYFCEHDLGEAAESFWSLVQTLGSQVELLLSQWALEQLGFDLRSYYATLDALAPQLPTLIHQEAWPNPIRQSLWGNRFGRETEFYQRCAQEMIKHRHELWVIACERPLYEAKVFEAELDRIAGEESLEEEEAEELCKPAQTWKALQALLSNNDHGV